MPIVKKEFVPLMEVPKSGWFVDLRGEMADACVYHNGELVGRIQSIAIEASVNSPYKITTIKFIGGEAIAIHSDEATVTCQKDSEDSKP